MFTHEKEKSCYRVDFEQEMVPFGSGCEFEGEAIVENRKGSRFLKREGERERERRECFCYLMENEKTNRYFFEDGTVLLF